MIIGYFTERPYRWLPEDEVLRNEGFFAVSNKYFDREKAADDYNYWIDEYCEAEELGFDALMLNEHHGNPLQDPASRALIDSWTTQPGMLGLRLTLHEKYYRPWLTDGTAD